MGMTKSLTGQSTSGIWFRYLKSARVQVWWCTPVISALGRLKQEDLEFEANLDYRVRPCLKKKKIQNQINKKWSNGSFLV
jgi:hypothetical protein